VFCSNCGYEIADDALFCPNCGLDKNRVPGRVDTRLTVDNTGPDLTSSYIFAVLSIALSGSLGWLFGILALTSYKDAVVGYQNPPKAPKILAIIGISLNILSFIVLIALIAIGIAQNGLWSY